MSSVALWSFEMSFLADSHEDASFPWAFPDSKGKDSAVGTSQGTSDADFLSAAEFRFGLEDN